MFFLWREKNYAIKKKETLQKEFQILFVNSLLISITNIYKGKKLLDGLTL